MRGIAWSGGLKWASQIVTWAFTMLIARMLTPADYGVFGLATLYLGVVQLFNEAGIGAAIVQRRDLENEDISELGGAAVVLGLTCCIVSVALAQPFTLFFREPGLFWVLVVLSLTFVIQSAQVLPRAILSRELRFREVASLDAVEALLGSVFTLGLAIAGFGYWALVLGALGRVAVTSGIAVVMRPFRLARPRHFSRLRGALTFSRDFLAARLAWYAYSNADFAIVGRVLGTSALGAYTIGWTFSGLAVDKVTTVVSQVVAPVFSAVQTDVDELRRYLLRLSFALAIITLPASAGLALVAPDLVSVVLGPQWEAAVLPLQILSAYMGMRSLTALLSQLMFATGNGRYGWRYNLVALLVLPPLFYIGTRWGTAGVATGWLVGYPVVGYLFLRLGMRIVHASMWEYFSNLIPAINGVVVMSASVLAFYQSGIVPSDPRLRLAAAILVGTITYAGTLLLFHRKNIMGTINAVRSLRPAAP